MQETTRIVCVKIDVDVPIREDSDIDDLMKLSMTDLLDKVYHSGWDMRRRIKEVPCVVAPPIEQIPKEVPSLEEGMLEIVSLPEVIEPPVRLELKPLKPISPSKRKR